MWLGIHNAPLTSWLRLRRGLAGSAICLRCTLLEEDIFHCLRDCVKAQDVWNHLGIGQT
ncbi:hypothetical protein AHAS_Ahas01G0171100 [Arachis hypogaea]